MADKEADRMLDMILSQLERLNSSQEKLSEELQSTNIELAKISGLRHVVGDLKRWKEERDQIITVEDLGKLKTFYYAQSEVNSGIKELAEKIDGFHIHIEDFKSFKVRVVTIITIASILLTSAITVLGWFLHH